MSNKIKASSLPSVMKNAIKWGGVEMIEIKINGEYQEIINDLKGKK